MVILNLGDILNPRFYANPVFSQILWLPTSKIQMDNPLQWDWLKGGIDKAYEAAKHWKSSL